MNNALHTLELHTQKLIQRGLMKRADFIENIVRPILSATVGEDASPELEQRYRNYADYTGKGPVSAIPGLLKLVNSMDNIAGLAGENYGGQKYNAYQHMFYGNNDLYTMYNSQQGHMLSDSGGITPATLYGMLNDMADTTSPRGKALVKHLMTPQGQRTRDDLVSIMTQYKPLMNADERAQLDNAIGILQNLQTDNPRYGQQKDYGEGFTQYKNIAKEEGRMAAAKAISDDSAVFTGAALDWGKDKLKKMFGAEAKPNELPIEITPERADLYARFGGADTVHAQLSQNLRPVLTTMENSPAFNYKYNWAKQAINANNYEKWGNTPQERRNYINNNFKKPPTMANPNALIDPSHNLGSVLRAAIPGMGIGLPLALLSGRSGSDALIPMLLASAGMGCYGYGRRQGQFGAPNEGINPMMDSMINGFWNLPQMFGFGGQQGTQPNQQGVSSAPQNTNTSNTMYNPQNTYQPYNTDPYQDQTQENPQFAYQQPEPNTPQQVEPYQPSIPNNPQYSDQATYPQQNTQYI